MKPSASCRSLLRVLPFVAVGYLLHAWGGSDSSAEQKPTSNRALEARVEALQARVQASELRSRFALTEQQRTAARADDFARSPVAPGDADVHDDATREDLAPAASPGEEPDPEAEFEELLQSEQSNLDDALARLHSQAAGTAWSQQFRERIADSFASARLHDHSEIVEVDCRENMCAVEVAYGDAENLQKSIDELRDNWLMKLPCGFMAPGAELLDASGMGNRQQIILECTKS